MVNALFLYKVTQQLPEYGVLFHRVSQEKKGTGGDIVLGICAKGIIVYEVKNHTRIASLRFQWRETERISAHVSWNQVNIFSTLLQLYSRSACHFDKLFHLELELDLFCTGKSFLKQWKIKAGSGCRYQDTQFLGLVLRFLTKARYKLL